MNIKANPIRMTKNYKTFFISDDNRKQDPRKHLRLRESMKKYGFIDSFPIVCICRKGKLFVVDGQHRLYFAEQLDLPVYYVISQAKFDVADVNNTPKTWTAEDFAVNFHNRGNKNYTYVLEFSQRHSITLYIAAGLLCGHNTHGNVNGDFQAGKFIVKEPDFAEIVASTYAGTKKYSKALNNTRFLQAVTACCRVDAFDPARLVHAAKRQVEKLVSYSTRDGFLEMIEDVYNHAFAVKNQIPIKFLAIQAMKERSPIGKNPKSNGKVKTCPE